MSEHIKDYNSPEELDIQEDPIVMYLVVHEIGMSAGKMAAQVGHAVGMLYDIKYDKFNKKSLLDNEKLNIWEEWQGGAFRKVTLTANDSKWNKLKIQLTNDNIEYWSIRGKNSFRY